MNSICLVVFLFVFGCAFSGTQVRAQADAPSGPITLSQADLQDLVAPIALYPDPLIALILPASTVPTDIVLAERYLSKGGNSDDIDNQPWDDNVKGLARYPEVIEMMSENLDWTNQLGAAVLFQQADGMAAIQAQRAKAKALGNLATTSQQDVETDGGIIQIYPANPEVIYVPVYDPVVVYVQPPPPIPFISFGTGFHVGIWLGGGCDWRYRRIYSSGYYRPGYGWRPGYNHGPVWRPNPTRPRPRPPYRPGRPGSQLPGFRPPPTHPRPPGGNRPGKPGWTKPAPDYGGTKPGHGTRPNPGIKPGRPIQPQPGRPGTKPAPVHPVKPPVAKPEKPVIKPAPIKPAPQPGRPEIKPAPAKPRPQPDRPAIRPSPGMPSPHPGTSRPANPKRHEARPAPSRPRPQPAAQRAPAHGQKRSPQ